MDTFFIYELSGWDGPFRTGEPGVLQFTGLQRVKHDLLTEQQQLETITCKGNLVYGLIFLGN